MHGRQPLWSLLLGNPFEMLFGVYAALAGVPLVVGVNTSTVAHRELGPTLAAVWGVVLLIGGISVITGLCTRYFARSFVRKVAGVRIEQAGWTAMLAGTIVFITVLLINVKVGTIYVLVTYTAFAIASACRNYALREVAAGFSRMSKSS